MDKNTEVNAYGYVLFCLLYANIMRHYYIELMGNA